MASSSDEVRVAVIGAGPAGLVLARILQRNGFAVTVFEAELSAHARPQGGSLDLHVASGQRALREAGVFDEFLAKVQQGADASLLVDHTMKVYWADDGDGLRPEIERTDLRDLLLNSVAAGTVQWNRKLLQLQPPIDGSAGRIKVVFTDNSTYEADIVVGADGAWSKVRSVLTDIKPTYTGFSFIDIVLPHKIDVSAFKRGALWVIDDHHHVLIAHLGDAPHAYVGTRCPVPDEVRPSQVEEWTQGWAKEIVALATHPGSVRTVRPLVALPVRMRWSRDAEWKGRVAIIGDAAHVMSPFAGEGANLALADGADLARALVSWRKSGKGLAAVGAAIGNFERKCMWGRAERAAHMSARNMEEFVGVGGAQRVANLMRGFSSWGFLFRMIARYLCDLFWRLFGYRY